MPAPLTGVTLQDVAARCGVSIATVSRVITGRAPVAATTRERVEAAARELGYEPNRAARQLCTQRSDLVGVVAIGAIPTGLGMFLSGVESACRRRGRSVVFSHAIDAIEAEATVHRLADSHGIDGIVLLGPGSDLGKHAAHARGVAAVAVDPGSAADAVQLGGLAVQQLDEDDGGTGHRPGRVHKVSAYTPREGLPVPNRC